MGLVVGVGLGVGVGVAPLTGVGVGVVVGIGVAAGAVLTGRVVRVMPLRAMMVLLWMDFSGFPQVVLMSTRIMGCIFNPGLEETVRVVNPTWETITGVATLGSGNGVSDTVSEFGCSAESTLGRVARKVWER